MDRPSTAGPTGPATDSGPPPLDDDPQLPGWLNDAPAAQPPPAPVAAPAGLSGNGAAGGRLSVLVGEAPDELEGEPDEAAEWQRGVRLAVDAVVLLACVGFVFWQMQPDLLFRNTTPAGGDMGAHVWGPAYLRDHLLPSLQLTGWTPDWYAGFPAYQFYMVLPSLLIVALNAGVHGLGGWLLLGVSLGLGVAAVVVRDRPRLRTAAVAGALVAFALVGVPYGVAFKLVSVSGLVALPLAAYAFGRLGGLAFPTPAFLAMATLPYVFYRGYTIYGGNIASTLAGEFAFSMALSLALVYLGVIMRGLDTGRYRGWAAMLLALCGLCHLIVAFWALGATALAVAVRFRRTSVPPGPCVALVAAGCCFGLALAPAGAPVGLLRLAIAVLAVASLSLGLWLASESVRWLAPVMVVAGALSAFWVGPFFLRRLYLNDMGWEKLPYQGDSVWTHLIPSATPDVDLRWVLALAIVGAALSVALHLRAGIVLAAATLAVAVAFAVMPEGRLWNGRLLPFYYLTAMLLAGLAVPETVRTVARLIRNSRREPVSLGAATAGLALVSTLVMVGLPLGVVPYSQRLAGGGYEWPRNSPAKVGASPESFVTSWARWNYSGYELKNSYREYHDVVRTMQQVGEDRGCGRAFWEYEKELDRYGTPMALMLLPFWTDGCIASMEGLYFEASSTTPFHFITQVELSTNPSAAQRDLPYGTLDISRGVDHLQMLGVRYYMATSPQAVEAARQNPELTEVASSPPWVVFEVADSELVEPLAFEPAVLEGVDGSQEEWIEEPRDGSGRFYGPAMQWFVDSSWWDVALTLDGPDEWQRVAVNQRPAARPVDETRVTNIDQGRESLSFDVDQVGTPVLVKISYFPNWRVDGAEGPYRVTPNLMVVVPTERHVELSYGRTWVEYLSYGLTVLGVAGLVLLARRGAHRFAGQPLAATAQGDGVGGGAAAVEAGAGTPTAGDGEQVDDAAGADRGGEPPDPLR